MGVRELPGGTECFAVTGLEFFLSIRNQTRRRCPGAILARAFDGLPAKREKTIHENGVLEEEKRIGR
jgi:hypothetical protein